MIPPDVDTLTRALRRARTRSLVICTGAGISLASGLATFRGTDPDAVWSRDDVEMGTREFFETDPVESWRWYASRFAPALDAAPNPAHEALAALERWQTRGGGRFLLVTQNVDLLHERAGSRRLVKVHGSLDRVRCRRVGCPDGAPSGSLPVDVLDLDALRDLARPEDLPRCPRCEALLRPHVLWFDEMYTDHADYRFDEVRAAAGSMDAIVFVGTSFAVGVTALLVQATLDRGAPAFSVDPGADPARMPPGVTLLRRPAEEFLPSVCASLGAV